MARPLAADGISTELGTPRALAVAIAVLAALALQIAAFHDLRHDDAYITFRYAQNWVEHGELVFNRGERLMASTAPGHVLRSALL